MSRKNAVSFFLLIAAAACLALSSPLAASPAAGDRESVVKIIQQIQKADYEADRAALHRLYRELAPFAEDKDLGVRVQYWRGFALWRSAINGFNDNAPKQELQQDLNEAIDEFEKSLAADPAFVDSKIAIASCLGFLAYSFERGSPQQQEHIARIRQTLKDAQAMSPDNPRLLWVLGPVYWNIPAERGGGQAKAMETYEKGLETIRNHKNASSDPLDPTWGEPELLMSLAWSNLNRATPDLKAAEQNAQSALALVPDWHYVRDILMKQIQDAKAKQGATS
jgi:tetratricopeptide (TPR) repeat protein